MVDNINYKQECLTINKKLKVYKHGSLYLIISGNERNHSTYSDAKDNKSDAWKDCYEKLNKDN